VVRQTDRVDSITGKGKSKGYGFLELHKHADALKVLRWANNNPSVNALLTDWWKDEINDLISNLTSGKAAKTDEDSGTRLKRLKDELEKIESGSGRKAKGALIIEFSIENVQVVSRRNAQQTERAQGPGSRAGKASFSRSKRPAKDEDESKPHRPGKRRKLDGGKSSKSAEKAAKPVKSPKNTKKPATPASPKEKKPGNGIGAVIGRKRKQRKEKSR